MVDRESKVNSVVIGGGFYGVNVALYLARQKRSGSVILIEKDKKLLARASSNNQARVHNGYHYPRSLTTAYRSRVNMPRFINDWPDAVRTDSTKIYAIARNNSKITAQQFRRFCKQVGVKLEPANEFKHLFDPRLIEESYLAEEYTFDYTKLAEWSKEKLKIAGVQVAYDTEVHDISRDPSEGLVLVCRSNSETYRIKTRASYNCTYSGLNQFGGDFKGIFSNLKHEITEIALMQMPNELKNLGITIMDGPFFSILPFPSKNLHSLSHVRYTPHCSWLDHKNINPYQKLEKYKQLSRIDRMIRDAQRYIPTISNALHKDSLFEVKTILAKNESDDGRPILFEEYPDLPGFFSILGGKIDNVYDVLEILNERT